MNTILVIILTIVFLISSIIGIFLFHINFILSSKIGIFLFLIGVIGLFFIGTTFIDDVYTKEIVCSYTVGKSDEVCMDIYILNYNFSTETMSDKISIGYFILDGILIILFMREFFILLCHMGDCVKSDY